MTDRPLPYSANTGAPAVVASDLTVDRGRVRALDSVSLTVPAGEITVLLGPNGSGKTTLMQVMLGLVTPTSGSVSVLSSSVRRTLRTGRVAAVPQSERLDDRFPVTAGEVVMQGRRRFTGGWRRPSPTDRQAVTDALERVGLSALKGRRIGELSGGQRRRVLLARCLAQEADLLLLDEPFNGMDAGSEEVYIDVLRELTAAGRTAVISTHHLGTVHRLADTVALLNGRLLAHGPVAETTTPQILSTLLGARLPGPVDSDTERGDTGPVTDRDPTTEESLP